MNGKLKFLGLMALLFLVLLPRGAFAQEEELWYFWGQGCPACREAAIWLDQLGQDYPHLVIRRREVWQDPVQRDLYLTMLQERNQSQSWVPCFIIGEKVWQGFNETVVREIEAQLEGSRRQRRPQGHSQAGGWEQMSPLAATVLIAFADGLNPCSLWVLTMLLAIVLHSQSRLKLALVGGVFLVVSAGVYGLFIASVFSVLAVARHLVWIRVLMASLALLYAAINIRGYFRLESSFRIAPAKRPGLFRSGRLIAQEQPLPAVLAMTVVFSAGATLAELPCTVGFPMVWTNLLAQAGIKGSGFLGLLLLYLLVFLAIEIGIVIMAIICQRVIRLQESHGRGLKLVGGMIMAALAAALIFRPSLLVGLAGPLVVIALALLGAGAAIVLQKKWKPRQS